jgi:allantoicase
VARLRAFGVLVAPPPEKLLSYDIDGKKLVDLVAMENGGVCMGLSDAHYGHPRNLIKKGRGINMGDGWETARRMDRPAILKVICFSSY